MGHSETEPIRKMKTVLDLFEVVVEMQRMKLKRRCPEADSARIDALLQEWLDKGGEMVPWPGIRKQRFS